MARAFTITNNKILKNNLLGFFFNVKIIINTIVIIRLCPKIQMKVDTTVLAWGWGRWPLSYETSTSEIGNRGWLRG